MRIVDIMDDMRLVKRLGNLSVGQWDNWDFRVRKFHVGFWRGPAKEFFRMDNYRGFHVGWLYLWLEKTESK